MDEEPRSSLGQRFAKKAAATAEGPPQALSLVAEKEKKKQRILLELENLPSLPSVVIEIMKLIQDPDSSARDFEEHVRKDQVLAGKMLKLVNSSFYSLSRKISTINEAVVVLGFNTLKSLVLATSTRKFLERQLSGYGYDKKGLWKHSISCAGGCKFLGRELGLGDMVSEEIFVAGLLHDIGKLILGPMIEENMETFRKKVAEGASALDAEQAATGFDHAAVAGLILKKWKLSEELADVIVHHHAPAAAEVHPRRAAILHVTNFIANRLRLGLGPSYPGPPPIEGSAYQALGVPDDRFRDLLEKMQTAMREMERLFAQID
ncbi:MAG: HDOD domain-containing protein [Planctomycetes bacterium]|nr:HDOD domain-containing protein [Planctomycetota bacterium]